MLRSFMANRHPERIREGSRLAESRLIVEIPRGVPLGMTRSALSSARKMSYTFALTT